GSECARLLSNRSGRSISVIPDLSGSENDEKRKKCAHWRQHTGGECSSAHPHGGRKLHDYRIDHSGAEVSTTEEHRRHPSALKAMEPIAQCCSVEASPKPRARVPPVTGPRP